MARSYRSSGDRCQAGGESGRSRVPRRSGAGGPPIHLRNLDWAVESGIQRFAQLTVVEPERGVAHVYIGWSGFLGAVSGVNRAWIFIAEIRASSAAASSSIRSSSTP